MLNSSYLLNTNKRIITHLNDGWIMSHHKTEDSLCFLHCKVAAGWVNDPRCSKCGEELPDGIKMLACLYYEHPRQW